MSNGSKILKELEENSMAHKSKLELATKIANVFLLMVGNGIIFGSSYVLSYKLLHKDFPRVFQEEDLVAQICGIDQREDALYSWPSGRRLSVRITDSIIPSQDHISKKPLNSIYSDRLSGDSFSRFPLPFDHHPYSYLVRDFAHDGEPEIVILERGGFGLYDQRTLEEIAFYSLESLQGVFPSKGALGDNYVSLLLEDRVCTLENNWFIQEELR